MKCERGGARPNVSVCEFLPLWREPRWQFRLSPLSLLLTGSSEQAAPRIEQVRLGAFARQLRIALYQGLQNCRVILRRALMKRQFTPGGTLASAANDACDLNQ